MVSGKRRLVEVSFIKVPLGSTIQQMKRVRTRLPGLHEVEKGTKQTPNRMIMQVDVRNPSVPLIAPPAPILIYADERFVQSALGHTKKNTGIKELILLFVNELSIFTIESNDSLHLVP